MRLQTVSDAQKNLHALSEQMVSLQDILSNKQTRGAFGEVVLESQLRNILPPDLYSMQYSFENRTRVDCLIHLPNPPGPIAVDAKFPLEAWQMLHASGDAGERERARKKFVIDLRKHIDKIAGYVIPGETCALALMYIPSEAVFAEIYHSAPELVEQSQKKGVIPVSPTSLMAVLHNMRAWIRDVKINEQAKLITEEIGKMQKDFGRLGEALGKLKNRHRLLGEDIDTLEKPYLRLHRQNQKFQNQEALKDQSRSAPALGEEASLPPPAEGGETEQHHQEPAPLLPSSSED